MLHYFTGKKVLLGISGSIAAYKSILLVRLLKHNGADVRVILTPSASAFVSPLVLETLSKNKVLYNIAENSEWANHVELGRWADVFVIAPLTCNTLAKMAAGICDNLLLATYFSATCPVVVAPAMDEDMWKHAATKRNLHLLQTDGVKVMQVNSGSLASGLVGEGRMAEPEEILYYLLSNVFRKNSWSNKKVLITAGPTQEHLDPVRYISNHSSGKMGFALAEACFMMGAEVNIIAGPTEQKTLFNEIHRINVVSAREMYEAVSASFNNYDIAIMAAAVADFSPVSAANTKIKKQADKDAFTFEFAKTQDILAHLGVIKSSKQLLVGFALETDNELENAHKKLVNKNADVIILNSMKDANATFGFDTNKIAILSNNKDVAYYSLKEKDLVAIDIVEYINELINEE